MSKLLPVFIDPAGLTLVFLAAGVLFAFLLRRKWVWVSPALILCGFLVLLFFSLPIGSHWLMRGLEKQYSPSLEYAPASAVVLLGGFTTGKIPPRAHVEINHSGNRAVNAARVFRQSGSRYLVVTGGIVSLISDDLVSEADAMFELMTEVFGVDSADIIIEDKAQNTRENAVYTMKAMEEAGLGKDIILVTSAYHMPRAAAVFRKLGFDVTPAPTGYFKNEDISTKPLRWLPSSFSLLESFIAMREYCGYWAYKMFGWV